MLKGRWLAAFGALGLALPASAASYDPDLTWRTLTTEHFHIHFHQGIEQVAEEFSHLVEEVYDTLVEELQWEPRRRTELVLVDRTDSANGYAMVVPYNQIVIYVTAPQADSTLNLYEDWSTAIFTHELTHILHMDANHGIVRLARGVVGRVASTNDVSPRWMVEGLATFQETRHTTGGRGRGAYADMIKRTAVVEDQFPPLGNLDGIQPKPPGGNLRYLFGQDFIQFVAEQTGEDVWTRWIHTYGSHVPFVLPSRKVFGKRLVPLYFDWRDHLYEKYGAQVEAIRAEGETVGRLLSVDDASCVAPAFSPDGESLVWSCYDLRQGSAIWRADGDGNEPEILLQDRGASYFTWRADSKAFVYAGSHIVNQFNVWSDIYMHTLGGGTVALTQGARARDPDFSPDGSRLLYVTNRAQNNQLEVMTVDRRRRPLTDYTDHTQLSTPRFSPDGQVVALSMWQHGRRDLWLFSPEGEPLRRLTADQAIDVDPVWSADGRYLFFSSDRSGVYNIYAIDTETERLWQVTHVLTGAMKPTIHPSGRLMAYQQYSADGWDIRALELDPDRWLDRGLLPRQLTYGTPLKDLLVAEGVATAWSVGETSPAETAGSVDPTVEIGDATGVSVDEGTAGEGSAAPAEGAAAVGATTSTLPAPALTEDLSGWSSFAEVQRAKRGRLAAPYDPLAALSPRQDVETVDSFDDAYVRDVFGQEQDYPFTLTPRRYNPLPTLLPRYVLPFVQTTPQPTGPTFGRLGVPFGLQGTLSTQSSDTLRHFAWAAQVSYRTDAEALGGGVSLTYNRFIPVFTFGASTRAVASSRLYFLDPAQPVDEQGELRLFTAPPGDPAGIYWERRMQGYAQVSWPYRLRSTLFARYSLTHRRELNPLPAQVYQPLVPLRGTVGALSGGWRYSWSQQTAYAISREDARIFSFVGSVLHPWLGTRVLDEQGQHRPLSQLQLTSELREYVVNPLLDNHVLAMRAAGGVTLGATDYLGNYQLGGSFGDSAFYATPEEFRMLRGYPFASDFGDMYWLLTAEYRFPIWYIHRGVGTIPAYARHVSGAVYVDTGNAFNSPATAGQVGTVSALWREATTEPLVGVGAELSFATFLAWGVGLNGRLGYGVGLTGEGFRPGDPQAFYFQLGGSF